MLYAFYIHECTAADGGVTVKARTVRGHVCSGTTIHSMTYLTYGQVIADGEYIENVMTRQDTRVVEFGPLVVLEAAVTDADGAVPTGFGFWANIAHVPAGLS